MRVVHSVHYVYSVYSVYSDYSDCFVLLPTRGKNNGPIDPRTAERASARNAPNKKTPSNELKAGRHATEPASVRELRRVSANVSITCRRLHVLVTKFTAPVRQTLDPVVCDAADARIGETVPELEITELRVPQVVEDGSATSVILDCDYNLRSADKRSELVVQWYFQNGTSPVYQWIPGKKPQDLGILKGRLNLDYRASNDHYKRHRALEILGPTHELSGTYRCKVATVEEEATASRTMIVYSKSPRPGPDRFETLKR